MNKILGSLSFTTNTDTNTNISEVLPVIGQQEKVGPITEQYHEIFVSVFVFVVKLKLPSDDSTAVRIKHCGSSDILVTVCCHQPGNRLRSNIVTTVISYLYPT